MSIVNSPRASGPDLVSNWSEAALDTPVIDITPTPYLQRKGLLGRLFALVLLLISLPVVGLLIILVRLGSRGPGMYKQVRVGKDGRIFVMYKLRSMVQDAEVGLGPVWTQDDNDPRITAIGRFLRKSHLDELPQLLNVVRGEMSLFGPRPERPKLVQILADTIPEYLNRLAVRPGITGLAQINLPPDTDVESVRRKLQLDIEYIETATYAMEFRMFCWTVLRLLAIPPSAATKFMGVGRDVEPVTIRTNGPITIESILNARDGINLPSSERDLTHAVEAIPMVRISKS